MSQDISKLLDEWPLGESPNVRKIIGDDGREKLQIRVCVDAVHGILQMECDGRPDGQRPQGCEFLLDHLEGKRRAFLHTGGRPEQFRLTREQCRKLFDESTMTYQRYVSLLQLGDFERVIRDTARNMRLFHFVHAHAMHASDREHLERWWPYIMRIHHSAVIMRHVTAGRIEDAVQEVATCRERLRELVPLDDEVFRTEMKRSHEALDLMEHDLRQRLPKSELERLEHAKDDAVREQRFEEAARLRDRINALRTQPRSARSAKDKPGKGTAPDKASEKAD